MEGWVCDLTIVAANGNVTQLYPAFAAAGAALNTTTVGDQIRTPCLGTLVAMQLMTDGANGGILELYDINGCDLGIDCSAADIITDTQLDAAVLAGKAKLIFSQNFAGSGLTPWAPIGPSAFMKGLAARAVGVTGTCKLNLRVRGGFCYTTRG